MAPQLGDRRLFESHNAATARRFGWPNEQLTLDPHNLALDDEGANVEVDVAPPQPGVRSDNAQRIQAMACLGDVVPWERFRLAAEPAQPAALEDPSETAAPSATRKVSAKGKISFASQPYPVGVWLAGETVEVSVDAGLVTVSHRGVVVATHAQHHSPPKSSERCAANPASNAARDRVSRRSARS